MILLLAAALAAASPGAATDCASRSGADAVLCHALADSRSGRFAEAAAQFEVLARLSHDPSGSARAWAAAGNMWIAAGQPARATSTLERALAGASLSGVQRGEALLDRARAAEAQGDLITARAKVSEAAPLIAGDPFLWYFSAALAVRENDVVTARSAISRALALAPNDATILFEAGHVAELTGDRQQARSYWTRARAADPTGPAGRQAERALALLPVPLDVKLKGK